MRKELGSSFSAKGIADPRENSTPTAPKGAVASGAKPLNQPKVDAYPAGQSPLIGSILGEADADALASTKG